MRIEAGRLSARLVGPEDAGAGFALRAASFRGGDPDRDRFDALSRHLLIEGQGGLLGYARVCVSDGPDIARGYTGAAYGLEAFAARFGPAVEVGRVCTAPLQADADVPRLMLAALARIAEAAGAGALFGCTSFPIDAAPLGRLAASVAPEAWAPAPRAAERVPLAGGRGPVPPLMRAWLALGARVSDHGVVDRDLGTVHVFTALPVDAVPAARVRRLAEGLIAAD